MRSLRGNYLSNLHFARLIIWSKVSAKSPDCQTTSALASKESLEFSDNTERRGQKGNKHEGGGRGIRVNRRLRKCVCVCMHEHLTISRVFLILLYPHHVYTCVCIRVHWRLCMCVGVSLYKCIPESVRMCMCSGMCSGD